MPYGMAKDVGGDSPDNDTKMESCVKDLMSKGKDKDSAIAICKSSIQKSLRRSDKLKKEKE